MYVRDHLYDDEELNKMKLSPHGITNPYIHNKRVNYSSPARGEGTLSMEITARQTCVPQHSLSTTNLNWSSSGTQNMCREDKCYERKRRG